MVLTLTVSERKSRLGRGATTRIARKTKRTIGHTSQVLRGVRRDPVVEAEAAARVSRLEKRDVTVAELFPDYYAEKETASQAPTPD